MSSVCLYFQVHQPSRLRRLFYLDSSPEWGYFNEESNREIIERSARQCYLPANRLLLELIERHRGAFKVSFSISGLALEQLCRYAPEAVESFARLARTGCAEFLGETYFHSFASVFDEREFVEQVQLHAELMRKTLGVTPTAFCNTDLFYSDRIGQLLDRLGYQAVLTQGADYVLGWRSPNHIYRPEGASRIALLVRNARLSEDLSLRFSRSDWPGFPVTADKFAGWIKQMSTAAEMVNLFMGYEVLGERHSAESGIFDFFRHFPEELLKSAGWDFTTPSAAAKQHAPVSAISFPLLTSWTDLGCDPGAWLGNGLPGLALAELYKLAGPVRDRKDPRALDIWRRLQTADHFYYMHTKWYLEPQAQLSPFSNPHDAYVYYMNVLRDFGEALSGDTGVPRPFVTYPETLRVKSVVNE